MKVLHCNVISGKKSKQKKVFFLPVNKLVNKKLSLVISILCSAYLCISSSTMAGTLEQAKRLHDRIAGVPATAEILTTMTGLLDEGKNIEAAYLAMESKHFYNTTLKLFSTPWTNKEQDIFYPLNDYSATIIGMVRDDIDFRQILQADTTYVGNNNLGLPAYNNNNNDHYQAIEAQAIDLSSDLVPVAQSSLNGLPSHATAGVLTSRAAAKAFFYLGTNRAMLRFTLMNHLCTDLEPIKDNTRPPDRIRQDVSRSPGGDSRLFTNNCLACHSGMDPLAQAFAYYDYDFNVNSDPAAEAGNIAYNDEGEIDAVTGTRVQAKYFNNNTTFPYGYSTPNEQWINYWRHGDNRRLGWDPALSGQGNGMKSLGEELANSQAFAQCQVKKVFNNVCLRDAESNDDLAQISSTTTSFKENGYQLKRVFAEIGNYCMGE
ncbi:MAG: hypothetical protein ACPG52_03815 [Cognaticolwellia sp.]